MPVRNLEIEQAKLPEFVKINDKSPQSFDDNDWALFHKYAYKPEQMPDEFQQEQTSLQKPVQPTMQGLPQDIQGSNINELRANKEEAKQQQQAMPTSTYAMKVLQDAMRAKTQIDKSNLGESSLFKQAGIDGYSTLSASMAQRNSEMKSNIAEFRNFVTNMSGMYKDRAKQVADNYANAVHEYEFEAKRMQGLEDGMKKQQRELELITAREKAEKELAKFKAGLTEGSSTIVDTPSFDGDVMTTGEMKPEELQTLIDSMVKREGFSEGSMSYRHNNPGNIKFTAFSEGYGATKGDKAQDGGYFAKFPDLETGKKAMADLLKGDTYKDLSLNAAMKRWSGGGYDYNSLAKGSGKSIDSATALALKNLAVELYGKMHWNDKGNLDNLTNLYKAGKTIADIRRISQYKKFSAGLTKAENVDYLDAAENIAMSKGIDKEQLLTNLGRNLDSGNKGKVLETLKRGAIQGMNVGERDRTTGSERTVELISEISDDLKTLEASNVNTGIFTGTKEEVARNIKRVHSKKAREIAQKIQSAIVTYRKNMTGSQFSELEQKEYNALFPSISNTGKLNSAIIGALADVMRGNVDYSLGLAMGKETYNKLFKKGASNKATEEFTPLDMDYAKTLGY